MASSEGLGPAWGVKDVYLASVCFGLCMQFPLLGKHFVKSPLLKEFGE